MEKEPIRSEDEWEQAAILSAEQSPRLNKEDDPSFFIDKITEYAERRFASRETIISVIEEVTEKLDRKEIGNIPTVERKPWFEVLKVDLTDIPPEEEVESWVKKQVSLAVEEHFREKQAVSIRKMLRIFTKQNGKDTFPEDNEDCKAGILASMATALEKNGTQIPEGEPEAQDWGFIDHAKTTRGGNLRNLFSVLPNMHQWFKDQDKFLPADDTECYLVISKAMEIYLETED